MLLLKLACFTGNSTLNQCPLTSYCIFIKPKEQIQRVGNDQHCTDEATVSSAGCKILIVSAS